MKENRKGAHPTTYLTVHLVWAIKYRFHVLQGDVKMRCRQLLIQICDSEEVRILSGVGSKDHVHMHFEYRPRLALSELVKKLKGRSSRRLQEEFPGLRKRYSGQHFWAVGYGAWSSGNITDKVVQEYLEHHRDQSNEESDASLID